MSTRLGARLARVTLTALLLASCNALFGIEEGRPYPTEAGTAGSSGTAGAAGAGTGGSAGFDASSGAQDGSVEAGGARDAAGDVRDATSDVLADSCPLLNECGGAQRACWCNQCRSELDKCLGLGPCTAALQCILRADCAKDLTQCSNSVTTCPAHCSDIVQTMGLSVEPLRLLSECANSNPDCGACAYDRQCTQPCPIFAPANGQIAAGGCPPGGAECNYGPRRCECIDDAWACAG